MADAKLSHVPEFRDPTARVFLTDKGARSLARSARLAAVGGRGFRLEMARAMADMIGLRTAAIDTAVENAIGNGARQLVILGAGYDGRAWRMPALPLTGMPPISARCTGTPSTSTSSSNGSSKPSRPRTVLAAASQSSGLSSYSASTGK